MNTSIRKDSKVTAHTNNNVVVIGTVTSAKGDKLSIVTPSGVTHTVPKSSATKLSAAEFKLVVLEATQPKVEAKTEPKVDIKAEVKAEVKKQVKKEVKKEVAKVNKKAVALSIFADNTGEKRKVIIALFKLQGMSQACASTYYQNIKSGTWK